MPTLYDSKDPLKDGLAKITEANLDQITGLRIAKDFADIGTPFVGFEGKDKKGKYFQLRLDFDPVKGVHVNVMINDNEKHEYLAKDLNYTWYVQVLNNINGHYCEVRQNAQKEWETKGEEKNPQYIDGMKKFMRMQLNS